MTALLNVSNCNNRNTGDYYEDPYDDIPTSLLNENYVIGPRSFSRNSRHPSTRQNQFRVTTTPENDMEKIELWSGERTPLHEVQSVSSDDLLMLLGQNPTPHGLFLSDLQEATYEPDDHLRGPIERNQGPSKMAHLRPELHNSRDRVFTPEPELQLRLNENVESTIKVDSVKLDLTISNLSNSQMTSPTIPSEELTVGTEKTGSLGPTNMPAHFSNQLGTIVLDENASLLIGSGVPLDLSKGDNDSELLEAALMNSQESSLGEHVSSIERDRLLKEERVLEPTSLTKDNSLFKINVSLVKINKAPVNSVTNRKTHTDGPTLLIENSTSVWQDTTLKSDEVQEVTLIHDETRMDNNTTALGLNYVSNETKSMEMIHHNKEGPVPVGTENPDASILPDSANGMKKTHDKNSLSSGQRPGPKQLISLGSEKPVNDQNFLAEKNKVVVEEDEFTKDQEPKEMISPNSKGIFFTNLTNIQENDTHSQAKLSQEEIGMKEKLIQENVVLPHVYSVNGTKNFLKDLFLLSTKQNVESFNEGTYTPLLQGTRSLNDSATRAGIHMTHFSKTREEADLEGLGNQTKQVAENYPSTTRLSPNPSPQNLIAQRGTWDLKHFRLPTEEIKLEGGVILNDASTQQSKNMKYLTQGTLTQIEYHEKKKRAIIQSLLPDFSMRSHGINQTDGSALPIVKASAFPSIRPADVTKIPPQDSPSHLAAAYSYTFREGSSGIQESSHSLQGDKRNLSLASLMESIRGQENINSLGESAENSLIHKKLENPVLSKPGLSEASGKMESLPEVHIHRVDALPVKTGSGSPGHRDLVEEIFLQKTQDAVKSNKVNRPTKMAFLKQATESSEKTPSKLLDLFAWDHQHATQIPREEWKSQEKSQQNIAVKTKDTISPLDAYENNHSTAAVIERQDETQSEATQAKQGRTGRLGLQSPPVLNPHQREITPTPLQPEEHDIDYEDTDSIETKREDFDIYGEGGSQDPRSFQKRTRHYFIAAVEQLWDYGLSKSPHAPRNRYGYIGYSLVLW